MILFDTFGLSTEQIITQLAVILINLDYGAEIFTIDKEIKKNETPAKLFIDGDIQRMVKSLTIEIYNINLPYNLKFVLNMRIYNIISKYGMFVNQSISWINQHMTEIKNIGLNFKNPIANYKMEIKKIYNNILIMDLIKPGDEILYVFSGHQKRVLYSLEIPIDIFPYKTLLIKNNFINFDNSAPFQIPAKFRYPWRYYELAEVFDINLFKHVDVWAFDEGYIVDKNLYFLGTDIDAEKLIRVRINRGFLDVVGEYVAIMQPINSVFCKEVLIKLYTLWVNKTPVKKEGLSFKIGNIIIANDSAITPGENDIVIIKY